MNSHLSAKGYQPSVMSQPLFVTDLTNHTLVQLTLGSSVSLLGFMVMSYPVIDTAWFNFAIMVMLFITSVALNIVMLLSTGSVYKLVHSVGFKRYTLFVINLLCAALLMISAPKLALGYLAWMVLLYFFLDEGIAIYLAMQKYQMGVLAIRVVDFTITVAAMGALIMGLEVGGALLVSLPIGLKLVFFGAEHMLSMRQ